MLFGVCLTRLTCRPAVCVLQWHLWGELVSPADPLIQIELVGLLYMCYNGVSGAKSRELHLLGAVWHSSEPEALLHLEGGLEAAAANDSEED